MREKIGIKTRKIPGEAGEHVAWPIEVLMIKEVEDEIDALVKKPFVSPEDPRDAEIVKNWGPNVSIYADTQQGQRELKGIDAINREGHDLGIMFKDLLNLYRKHGVKFWLILWIL